MNWRSRLTTALALSLSATGLVGASAQAVKLSNGGYISRFMDVNIATQ